MKILASDFDNIIYFLDNLELNQKVFNRTKHSIQLSNL